MSSMLSAPATIPPTSEASFSPAFAPLSVGTVNRSSASRRRPASSASFITGTRPADATRFGSSKHADATGRLCDSCICEMPFVAVANGSVINPILLPRKGILALRPADQPDPSMIIGGLRFTYDDDYRDRPGGRSAPTPLSLSMPLARRTHINEVVEPYLRGLLPDNENVLRRWGARYGVPWSSPFALLR